MSVSTGVLCGLISMLGFGIGNAMISAPSKKIGTKRTLFYREFLMVLIFGSLMVYLGETISLSHLGFSIIVSITGYIGVRTLLIALKKGTIGNVIPITDSSLIVAIICAFFFLGEVLSLYQLFWIGSCFLAIVYISLSKGKFKFEKASLIAIVSCLSFGIHLFLLKKMILDIGVLPTTLLIELFFWAFVSIEIISSRKSFSLPDKTSIFNIVVSTILIAIGALAFNYGLSVSKIGIVGIVRAAAPIISTGYGYLIFKQKISIKQSVAIGIAVFGIIMLSV